MTAVDGWPRLVGGHVTLDLVNTGVVSEDDRSSDVLASTERFLAWCEYAGFGTVNASPTLGADDERAFLDEAVRVRSALRSIIESIAERRAVDPAALATLRVACAEAIENAEPVIATSRLSWTWPAKSERSLLWETSCAAVDLLRSPAVDRVKLCPGCGFAFLDTTKNGSRRWCSMADCGTDEKARRFVARRAATRAGGVARETRL